MEGLWGMGQEEQHLELLPLLLCVPPHSGASTWTPEQPVGRKQKPTHSQVHQGACSPVFYLVNKKSIRKWGMGKSCLMLFQSLAGQYPVRPVFQTQGCRNGFLHTQRANTGVPQTPYLQTGTRLKKLIAQTILTSMSTLVFSLSLDPSFHNQIKWTWSSTQGTKFYV